MFKDIILEKASIWNKRFDQTMRDRGYTQRTFIKAYRDKFHVGSQADVSKWLHIGDAIGKAGKKRRFPAFETMQNIAEVLGVSVGYLIGETDSESFDMEKASQFTGLSDTSIKSIKNITSGKAIGPFYKYPDPKITASMEMLLQSPALVEYLRNIYELAERTNARSNSETDNFQLTLNEIPQHLREDAFSLWQDAEEAIDKKGVKSSPELWKYVDMLDGAAMSDIQLPNILEKDFQSAKYALIETHLKMTKEITESDSFQKLLVNNI